ncbi:hypothetical protein C8Q80DRAFT_1271292 [Daedaleopsis nitida]|nr:hypothetical protein C8Q80DRAFT_1271292 [Daedaleopsis nitida]
MEKTLCFKSLSGSRSDTQRKQAADDGTEGDDENDSELEDVEAHQEEAPQIIGKSSNALVWPRGSPLDEREAYTDLRLMRIGDPASDLKLSDAGFTTSASETETASEFSALSRTSSRTSASARCHHCLPSSSPIELFPAHPLVLLPIIRFPDPPTPDSCRVKGALPRMSGFNRRRSCVVTAHP